MRRHQSSNTSFRSQNFPAKMSTSVLSPSIVSFTEMATTLTEIHQAHAHMLKTGFIHNPFAAGRLISFSTNPTSISDSRIVTYADSVFSRIKNPNSFLWNTMIRAYAKSSNPEKSIFIFHEMLHTPIFPDQYSFTFALKACSSLRCIEEGQQIHGLIQKSGFGSDVFIQNTLIHLYSVVGYFEKARILLDRMLERNVISWNAILSAYVEQGLMGLALELFEEMPERNVESWNFMISGYVGIGLVDEARGIFDEMALRDLVSWNAMITGYAQSGQFHEVLKLFKEMQLAKVKPDNCTLVNVLSACAKVGGLSQGEWIHAYIDKTGIKIVGFLATALIDMYSKCGCIEKALRVFNDTTTRKDISTWNSMVAGLSLHGYGEQAVKLFFEMVEDGYQPNEITFISVLSACSRSGLLGDGCKIFELMVCVHEIKPTIEHYGCMVDLYARAGLLEEAEEFIKAIPSKKIESVLECLLSACTSHGNVEMAERLAKKILDMNPSDSSSYVQLSNVYAMKGRWEDVREVRRMMRLEKVRKEPGCSLIEIDGVVHEFLAGDGLHCEDEIIGNS